MKTYYTISEIGKLLGLTTDAIRFYEKKGLVHPKLHPHNHYRMYHLDNVLELLDIIYSSFGYTDEGYLRDGFFAESDACVKFVR